jgi:hypothetical protein
LSSPSSFSTVFLNFGVASPRGAVLSEFSRWRIFHKRALSPQTRGACLDSAGQPPGAELPPLFVTLGPCSGQSPGKRGWQGNGGSAGGGSRTVVTTSICAVFPRLSFAAKRSAALREVKDFRCTSGRGRRSTRNRRPSFSRPIQS